MCDFLCDFNAMQRNGTQASDKEVKKAAVHGAQRFVPVKDSRKRKVRGMVTRNGKFYAQMRIATSSGKSKAVRMPLKSLTLDAAIAEAEKMRTEKRSGDLHTPGRRPLVNAAVTDYLVSAVFKAKKIGTQQNETQALNRWVKHCGRIRVDWITEQTISSFRDARSMDEVTPRTINLDCTAFNNLLRHCKASKWITKLPHVPKLKEAKPARRPLLGRDQIEAILKAADSVTKNAKLLQFYLRFLAACGAREQEALKIKKADVDLSREIVCIGADGDTKNGTGREVQFNSTLREVLKEIMAALPPDTQYLFPSPMRGNVDRHAKSIRESFYAARKLAGLEWVGFHDFRHYFASRCVMAGLDYMTIAKWLGHSDGGILVASTYGHINDAHERAAAKKLAL